MMLVPPFFAPILSPALALSVLLELDTLPQIQIQQQQPLPVIEVIKVYGKLAGPTCFGKVAPKGSSCQITSSELKKELGILSTSTSTSASTHTHPPLQHVFTLGEWIVVSSILSILLVDYAFRYNLVNFGWKMIDRFMSDNGFRTETNLSSQSQE
eukprot:248757_1